MSDGWEDAVEKGAAMLRAIVHTLTRADSLELASDALAIVGFRELVAERDALIRTQEDNEWLEAGFADQKERAEAAEERLADATELLQVIADFTTDEKARDAARAFLSEVPDGPKDAP